MASSASGDLTDSQLNGLFLARPSGGPTGQARGWQPPSVEQLQQALPQYEVSAFIARGGMGAVYKGTQKALRRQVAIKVLPPDIEDGDLNFAARFKHEAQSMAQLSHPNIVAVHDAGETQDGLLYFVMEFIEGTDVARLIASEGRIAPQRAMGIIAAVCDALAFAHDEGIIHRDIKPSNIMLDKRGRVKVADFGLAKTVNVESTLLTGTPMAMGTPDFIAPEALIPGVQVDQRADLYAVGVMLYQMLTGRIPRGRFQLPSAVVPRMDKRFDAIVDKAMQSDRGQRYSTALEMKTDVENVVVGFSPSAALATLAAPAYPKRGPKLRTALLLIGLAAAMLVVGVWFGWKGRPAGEQTAVTADTAPALEPGAFKLFDAAAKLPKNPGVSWERGAVVLDSASLGLAPGLPVSRDAVLRADIRTNPEAINASINLRVNTTGSAAVPSNSDYKLLLNNGSGFIMLFSDQVDKHTELKRWPLSRTYGPDEWLRLELRTIGDELTVSVDGRTLGTVHDSSLTEAGGVMLYAAAHGYFRNIVYVPLNKPGSEAVAADKAP